jgi:hypothetical protein
MDCIVRLKGGLGNQLFQYALGRALCARHSGSLYLDLSLLGIRNQSTTQRAYSLCSYPICASVLSDTQSAHYGLTSNRVRNWLASRAIGTRGFSYVREPSFAFWSGLDKLSGNLILDGFWQTERYFSDIRPQLLTELYRQPSQELEPLIKQAHSSSSVSIHIRRGDYVTNATAAAVHSTCPLNYYADSCCLVEAQLRDPHYLVFSDDPEWVSANLPSIGRKFTLVSGTGSLTAHDELFLMSQCRHHIVANSSFSWWGAWLSRELESIVVAPSKWTAVGVDTSDLIPRSWHVL